MKLLITGGQGQVGREFAFLNNKNIIALSHQECDITHPDSIHAAILHHQPTIIVNAAAYTAVDKAESEVELAYKINATGVANLAKACSQFDLPLIHLSTDYVFDGNKQEPYVETDQPNPQSAYGKSKLAGEIALQQLHAKHIILRVSWVFGQYGHNFVKTIIRLSKEREELKIVADQVGCPTAARSIAATVLNIAKQINAGKTKWGIYNYCNTPASNWFEFAKQVVQEARQYTELKVKNILPIITKEYPTPAQRPANSVLNCNKIQDAFAIIPVQWQVELATVCQQFWQEK